VSTINMFLRRDAGYVVAESLYTDVSTGAALMMSSKVIALPEIPAVVMVRGSAIVLGLLAMHLGDNHRESFDDLPRAMKEFRPKIEAQTKDVPGANDFDIGMCGWSHSTNAPSLAFISSSVIHPQAPWESVSPGNTFICPGTDEMLADIPDLDALDPIRDGLMILQRQRQIKVPSQIAGAPDMCFVGGYAELYTIKKDSITIQVLGHWPDKAGEVPVRETAPIAQGATVHRWVA
jgi:hypothetical protein